MGEPTKILGRGIGNPGGYPITPEQAEWTRCRPEDERTPTPTAGQVGWYRHYPGGELVPAKVVSVAIDDQGDPNVFKTLLDAAGVPVMIDGSRVMVMVDDPRPSLLLETVYGMIETREARLPDLPGWVA